MIDEKSQKLDTIAAQQLLNEMRKETSKRKPTTPYVRIRRPWLGTLNWEKHKARLAKKRKARNKVARMTRRAQRRA